MESEVRFSDILDVRGHRKGGERQKEEETEREKRALRTCARERHQTLCLCNPDDRRLLSLTPNCRYICD